MTGSAGRGPSSEPPTLLELTGAGAPASLVGGKGEWLDRLIAAGFAVPSCLALTTAAYRLVAAAPGLTGFLAEAASGPIPAQGGHQQARDSADAAFLGVPLPDAVATAVAAASSLRDPGGLLVARSSATAEDLPGASFAGQYRSYLGVPDDAALERAIRLVWASLWYPEARAYRRFHGIDEQGLAMAVLVMRQVPAESAGVAFTVDPAGATGLVRVETVPGLGEGLVSGEVTPTVHLVPRRATGMRAEPEVDPLAAEVAALALRIESAFGEPQDVEWARDAAGLWVLQARPATGGSGRRGRLRHRRGPRIGDGRRAASPRWCPACCPRCGGRWCTCCWRRRSGSRRTGTGCSRWMRWPAGTCSDGCADGRPWTQAWSTDSAPMRSGGWDAWPPSGWPAPGWWRAGALCGRPARRRSPPRSCSAWPQSWPPSRTRPCWRSGGG